VRDTVSDKDGGLVGMLHALRGTGDGLGEYGISSGSFRGIQMSYLPSMTGNPLGVGNNRVHSVIC
jgi:hypothetical protein